ncbi:MULTISPECIES: hypothetical protein [Vibrio harveyi group]|uniref:hypothetical protein n=1 Tax=Vibrio harveyi group TaxID=717610 RepID=UPI001110FA4D|nr:hypothetical protein [Vibrio parahaemolyticus]MDG2761594.1 hypothetical protein [Vibrio parahaemolyticus]TMX40844.1 hypothetical protein DA098_03165 [Vibrio parahaemolyticus]TMX79851.1 hypothetical protein DA094_05035 [Vibrio parahaemolyticus]
MVISEIQSLHRSFVQLKEYLEPDTLSDVQRVVRRAEGLKRINRLLDEARMLKQNTKIMLLHSFVGNVSQIPESVLTVTRLHKEVGDQLVNLEGILE